MSDKFMVIGKVEDYIYENKVVGRTIYDTADNKQNIKKGKGGSLEKRWEELDAGVGRAIKLEMSEYKGNPFVANFEWVEDKFVEQAQKKVEDTRGTSIETQVAIKEIGECWRVDKMKDNEPEVFAYRAWILDKLNGYIKGGKDEQKTTTISQPKADVEIPHQEIGEPSAEKPVTLAEVMKWAISHGKEYTPSWIQKQLSKPIVEFEPTDLYRILKEKTEWED